MGLSQALGHNHMLSPNIRPGLQGLEAAHRGAINCNPPNRLGESVDIEKALKPTLPNEPHWDYALSWRPAQHPQVNAACFIEVHPANSFHVDHMIAKKNFIF